MHIVGLSYRGGELDGPNCNRLLDNLASLEEFVPEKFQNFVQCLKLFSVVKKACFGMTLCPDYRQKIQDFEVSYRQLGISVTPKGSIHN